MLKRGFFCCIFLLFLTSVHSQKVGLVLSGGGAKGAVHIGIIKALEDNDIPIDYIAGTSVGAIVGSLYAMGYTPEEMLELFLSEDFYHWQTGKVEDIYQYYSRKNASQPDFIRFTIPLDTTDIKSALIPNSLVNPIQMNQAFLQLFSQANAQCRENFDELFVPFLCISSDVYHKEAVVSRNGDLGDAVRASMTFPLVFKPIMKDSVPLFDGGIYDNFPVQPMKKAFKPDIIIGSSVAGGKKKQPQEMDMYDLMENMVMQQTVYDIDPKDGIMMKFLLENVSLLDFNKSKTLFDMGYQYATGMIDSIKSRVERRVPAEEVNARRSEYNSNLPPLVFNHIYITGINEAQKSFIESQIHRNRENQFTIADFKKMYFRLLANPKIKEILPHAVWDPEKESFDLYLDIQIRNEITMAFGGNVSSISANQLYLGLGYQSLTEISSGIRLDMQVGNTYTGAALLGKVEIPSAISFDISGMLVYNYRKFYESEKLFIDTDIMTFIHQRESFGKISAGFPFHNNSKLDFLLGYGTLDDKYYQNTTNSSYNKENLDRSNYHLFSTGVSYKKYSQDAKQYPIRGQDHRVNLQYLSGNEKFLPYVKDRITPVNYHSWLQLDASLYNLHTMSNKFNFGYDLQGMASTKELLNNYTASVLQAPAYTPTPHSKLIMNEAFRANQFIAGGIIPILKINSSLFIRGDFHGFLPVFPIQRNGDNKAFYGDLFTKPAHLEEVSLIFQLSFISVGLYANHYSYPDKNWNFGLNIGYLIFNPKFIP